jgi:hypothetical protein
MYQMWERGVEKHVNNFCFSWIAKSKTLTLNINLRAGTI